MKASTGVYSRITLYDLFWMEKDLFVAQNYIFPISFTLFVIMSNPIDIPIPSPPLLLYPSINHVSSIAKEIKQRHVHCDITQRISHEDEVKSERECVEIENQAIICSIRQEPSSTIVLEVQRRIQHQCGRH